MSLNQEQTVILLEKAKKGDEKSLESLLKDIRLQDGSSCCSLGGREIMYLGLAISQLRLMLSESRMKSCV